VSAFLIVLAASLIVFDITPQWTDLSYLVVFISGVLLVVLSSKAWTDAGE
jgi:hypothetical protein